MYVYTHIHAYVYKGRHKKWNLFIKNCVFILTCLNFGHLQSALHLTQHTYPDVFSYCSKQFLHLSILIPFSASAVFGFTCSLSAKCFPLRTSSSRKTKKKVSQGPDQVNRKGGTWGSCHFWSKIAEPSMRCWQVHS